MSREASTLLKKLVLNFDAEEWNEFDLPKLRGWELEILARLLGAPKSGTKEKVIVRLLCTRVVRQKISRFSSDEPGIVSMVGEFRKEALKWMAKQMCLWRSGNKRQLAATLLSWRDRVRSEGEKYFKEITATAPAGSGVPAQMRFPF